MCRAMSFIGLALIGFGTGGIKRCVSTFGGEQFKIPEQSAQIATFFSIFYAAINYLTKCFYASKYMSYRVDK